MIRDLTNINSLKFLQQIKKKYYNTSVSENTVGILPDRLVK